MYDVDRVQELYGEVAESLRQVVAYQQEHGRVDHTALVLIHIVDEEIVRYEREGVDGSNAQ